MRWKNLGLVLGVQKSTPYGGGPTENTTKKTADVDNEVKVTEKDISEEKEESLKITEVEMKKTHDDPTVKVEEAANCNDT